MSDVRKAIMARLGEFARPGAKAEMGSVSVTPSATTADLIKEAQRLRDKIKATGRDFDKALLREVKKELDSRGVLLPYGADDLHSRPGAKAAAAKPESQEAESEEVKAGLKLMEKADEKVSEKIRTLIKEGKPQDQAVAIALDMKRRGEL